MAVANDADVAALTERGEIARGLQASQRALATVLIFAKDRWRWCDLCELSGAQPKRGLDDHEPVQLPLSAEYGGACG